MLLWSEYGEITGMVCVAISHKVSLFGPLFQQTIIPVAFLQLMCTTEKGAGSLGAIVDWTVWRMDQKDKCRDWGLYVHVYVCV